MSRSATTLGWNPRGQPQHPAIDAHELTAKLVGQAIDLAIDRKHSFGDELNLRDEGFRDDAEVKPHFLAELVESAIDGVESVIHGIESCIDFVESCVNGVESYINGVESFINDVEAAVDPVESRVDAFKTPIDCVETGVEAIEAPVDPSETGVEAVEAQIHAIEPNGQIRDHPEQCRRNTDRGQVC